MALFIAMILTALFILMVVCAAWLMSRWELEQKSGLENDLMLRHFKRNNPK